MKANELMIGDCVILYDLSWKVSTIYDDGYTKLKRWSEKQNQELVYLCNVDLLSPIQLTEEILKANGFIKGDIDFGYSLFSDVSFMVDIDKAEKGIVTKEMRFVHEVQQALRLCGLYDIADNFKITHN